jgi:hypothetical protein
VNSNLEKYIVILTVFIIVGNFFIALNQSNLLFFGESKITKHSQAVENDEHFLTIEQFEDLEKRLKANDYI